MQGRKRINKFQGTEDGGRTADGERWTTKGERFPVVEFSRFPITCAKYIFLTLQLPEIMNK